ncbi:MAG: ABC transporter ATP-binding protein [Ruminococcaceae bacterium]|nr:ABC transporter ATP-binding protein [Oscillospiraceae bacterium]
MYEYYPLLILGGIIGAFSLIFLIAYLTMKDKKESIGFDRNMKDSEIVRRLLKYARPHLKSFLLVLALMLFSIAYDIIAPLLIGNIEELIKHDFPLSKLFLYVGFYASILVVSQICSYFQAIVLQKTGQKILSALRQDLFTHIECLSHNQLNSIPVGTLVTRVTNDTNAISMLFTNILVNLIKNCFIIMGVLVAMLCLNYALTLMVLCFVPFIVLFTVIFRKFTRKAYRKVKDGTTAINTFLSENLSGMKIIQIFNREQMKKKAFDEKNEALARAKRRQILTFGIFRPVVYMLYVSSLLCLFYLGGKGYIEDRSFFGQVITSGVLVTFYMYISKFFNPIQSLAEQFNWLQSAFASAEKIFTVMDMQPQIVDREDAIELERCRGEIEFRDVWFAYKDEEWVLKGVSFKVEAGQTVAFVGSTGSGKTTILSLLCRNYDIQKGQILLDGIDIRRIKISSLRRQFGQMLQDVFLFSGTVRSNIVLRSDDVSEEEILAACRYVNADKIIDRLPKGLDEEVRERGNNFSQGQRQLISFARTIVHKPAIMILDEATANIDTETELLIQDSLEKIMKLGTLLMVAHRLSTIRHADNIIYLSGGKIVEQGSHKELLEKKGRYYGLYMLQYDKELLKNNRQETSDPL